ncbi:hypothetical protein HZQ89_08675 [Elizabethkingia anophelis]|nr:hypothetical protein [Elizabethkingia anophelis]MCT4152792.1 hypothetical protein [Elizabethkingia anophelis]MCT4316717.1 hypothetical protein [Elizabethkingia anophelis]
MKKNNLEITKDFPQLKKLDNISQKRYVSPKIEISFIEMEQGIAAQSANLNPGTSSDPFTPRVEDWNNKDVDKSDFYDI